ncbi:hypothetical protein NDU88_003039 [Pleurodeles waltl]|uniref:Uncharacterized protein n=1 Tax=Pleurodeles waltl TaxID=8319 RepID=A0AAV7KTR9_PLEWA|nr:hypothetical protein NDU88_003039 [Pleurodeles waltl]
MGDSVQQESFLRDQQAGRQLQLEASRLLVLAPLFHHRRVIANYSGLPSNTIAAWLPTKSEDCLTQQRDSAEHNFASPQPSGPHNKQRTTNVTLWRTVRTGVLSGDLEPLHGHQDHLRGLGNQGSEDHCLISEATLQLTGTCFEFWGCGRTQARKIAEELDEYPSERQAGGPLSTQEEPGDPSAQQERLQKPMKRQRIDSKAPKKSSSKRGLGRPGLPPVAITATAGPSSGDREVIGW